jgi:sugar lactone lactonase YvrE
MTGLFSRIAAILLAAALTLVIGGGTAWAQPTIRSFTGILEGHNVGGVTIDLVGNIYVADFGDVVWKITPEGEREVFASGLYGASGNAIDAEGNLLQSNFYGNSITKIDRKGGATPFVTRGLSGPVGIAVNRRTGVVYVANCSDNSIAKVGTDGTVTPFAKSDLFRCPNGVSLDPDGNLYVANFRDNKLLKVDATGVVALFANVSEAGLGHLCFKDGRFYVTAFQSHAVYDVTLKGAVTRILGNGERGLVDGDGTAARLSFPNGIACSASAPRLYINESVNGTALPRRTIIREITLTVAK